MRLQPYLAQTYTPLVIAALGGTLMDLMQGRDLLALNSSGSTPHSQEGNSGYNACEGPRRQLAAFQALSRKGLEAADTKD